MKKMNFLFRHVLFGLSIILMVQSCKKESTSSKEGVKANNSPIVKEFEIKNSWVTSSNLKSAPIVGDVYANFGVGYNELTNEEKTSIFNPGNSVSPLVSTTIAEANDWVYSVCTDYSKIDETVSNTLTASLGISVGSFKLGGNLTVTNSTNITNEKSSIYVNVLYIRKYGRGYLNVATPAMNDYLIYKTSVSDGQGGTTSGINIPNSTFRDLFGDDFRYAMIFGTLMAATVQITNVDYTENTKETVSADAKASVSSLISAGATWSSIKTSNSHFKNSNLVISGHAVPRTTEDITSIEALNRQSAYLTQCYLNQDLGIISNEYMSYTDLYPNYTFININAAKANLLLWQNALSQLTGWKNIIADFTTINIINAEIAICNVMIPKCKANEVVPPPGSYSAIEEQVYRSIPTIPIRTTYLSVLFRCELYTTGGVTYNGKAPLVNYDPSILKPIYMFSISSSISGGWALNDYIPNGFSSSGIPFYVFKVQKFADLIPLYIAEKSVGRYDYSNSTSDIRSGFSNVRLLGWVFPN